MCDPSMAPMIFGIPERLMKALAHCSKAAMLVGNEIRAGFSRAHTDLVNRRMHLSVVASERPLRIKADVMRYVVPCARKTSAVAMMRSIPIGGRPRPSCRRRRSGSMCFRTKR